MTDCRAFQSLSSADLPAPIDARAVATSGAVAASPRGQYRNVTQSSARRLLSLTKQRGAPLVPVAGADMPADIAHALRLLSACGRRAFMLTNWARRDFGAL